MNRREFLKYAGVGVGSAALMPSMFAVGQAETTARKTDPFHSGKKFFIAHRGASAYAPENTIPAYQLAIKQGADTSSGSPHLARRRSDVLPRSHSNRTTNVHEVFPNRFKEETVRGHKVKTGTSTISPPKKFSNWTPALISALNSRTFASPHGRKRSKKFAAKRAFVPRQKALNSRQTWL